jgi:hypothetical protein
MSAPLSKPVTGYGLAIHDSPDGRTCGYVDFSPVLTPAGASATTAVRRMRFTEGDRDLRQAGDVFCVDPRTAEFVREAINEKLRRDGEGGR